MSSFGIRMLKIGLILLLAGAICYSGFFVLLAALPVTGIEAHWPPAVN